MSTQIVSASLGGERRQTLEPTRKNKAPKTGKVGEVGELGVSSCAVLLKLEGKRARNGHKRIQIKKKKIFTSAGESFKKL